MNLFPRRRHELVLLVLLFIVVAMIGFWFGRVTAPEASMAFERGKAAGQALERQRYEQTRIELDILKSEIAAASAKPETEPSAPGEAMDASTSPRERPARGAPN